jgi:RNase H-fold protein (predicted Holliday junction resolvase)
LVEKFGKELVKLYPNIKIILQDERMSTKKATRHLKESLQLKCSQIKKIKDKMSAYIILEEYLYTINRYKKE